MTYRPSIVCCSIWRSFAKRTQKRDYNYFFSFSFWKKSKSKYHGIIFRMFLTHFLFARKSLIDICLTLLPLLIFIFFCNLLTFKGYILLLFWSFLSMLLTFDLFWNFNATVDHKNEYALTLDKHHSYKIHNTLKKERIYVTN